MLAIYDYGLNDAVSGSVYRKHLTKNLTCEDEWTRRRVFTAHSPEPGGRPGSADTCWRPGDPSPRVSTQHRACGCLLIKRTALLGGRGSPLDSETCQLALSLYSDSCPETGVPKAWQERRGRDSEPIGCVQCAIP